ncbi:hypothetical protein BGP77_00775 [Saccharospirillum sp. MSK14-1]|uniref:hypothetical protein n=1 Tax=Saccharospirillum sp. MSK14-1 TaxID=1897632 RepID=UPI000D35F3BC|nr:hypothetical protein [Saccharospirillum sp. MSK14-1]PTY35894.1 hypothetical protein BGP77_00775 [Saccharospirillum sp. MSK14-1]
MRINARIQQAVLVVLFAAALSGCGYQLKGQFRFAEGLSPLVWQANGHQDELYLITRNTFAVYGLELSERPADTLLAIHRVDDTRVELSEAEVLTLEVEWSLINAQGVAVIEHRRTRSETRLSLSPEIDEDEARLERQTFLRQRIALRLLDQLEAISSEALNRAPESP